MSPRHLVPLDQIVGLLSARAPELARELLPAGVREGHEWRCGSLGGEIGRSLAVHLHGPRAGVWSDFSSGEAGDALDLVAQCRFGGNKVEAIKWAKGWLGLDGTDPSALRQTRRAVEKRNDEPSADEEDAKKRAAAYRIFLSAREEIRGTPVESYLQGRGIDLGALPFRVGSLRFHPELWNEETRARHPAMVASIVGPDGKQAAVHRTWLQRDGARWIKLQGVRDAKMTLARYRGGFISLWKGIRIDPDTGEIRKNPSLAKCKAPVWVDVTEGIEDGLSVAVADPSLRVIAAVSVGNWRNIRLPEIVEGVVLWQQNDPPDSDAAKRFRQVVENFQSQGKRVRLARPPEGFKDPNEILQRAGDRTQEATG